MSQLRGGRRRPGSDWRCDAVRSRTRSSECRRGPWRRVPDVRRIRRYGLAVAPSRVGGRADVAGSRRASVSLSRPRGPPCGSSVPWPPRQDGRCSQRRGSALLSRLGPWTHQRPQASNPFLRGSPKGKVVPARAIAPAPVPFRRRRPSREPPDGHTAGREQTKESCRGERAQEGDAEVGRKRGARARGSDERVLDEDTNRLRGVVDEIGGRRRRRKREVLACRFHADVKGEPPAAPSREGGRRAQNHRRAGGERGDPVRDRCASRVGARQVYLDGTDRGDHGAVAPPPLAGDRLCSQLSTAKGRSLATGRTIRLPVRISIAVSTARSSSCSTSTGPAPS